MYDVAPILVVIKPPTLEAQSIGGGVGNTLSKVMFRRMAATAYGLTCAV